MLSEPHPASKEETEHEPVIMQQKLWHEAAEQQNLFSTGRVPHRSLNAWRCTDLSGCMVHHLCGATASSQSAAAEPLCIRTGSEWNQIHLRNQIRIRAAFNSFHTSEGT
ncbi:unnamed protein product [Pleuronectes platessa]|uniref:Uncharacterized protein n=1 Tax=Pleuronectes platessa TaxID=8262 RepID=A0A9N7U4J0_PLEPL|nr:unnamed protein product [Pleuronectes platessa]